VLIEPDQRSVEVFRNNPLGVWELHPSDSLHTEVHLLSIARHGSRPDG
jgi:hypothetical protein